MALEIEKKFRLTSEQRKTLPLRLREIGATLRGEEFEENILYRGAALEVGSRVLRLRRVGNRAILTFKQRLPSASGIKHQREDEQRSRMQSQCMRSWRAWDLRRYWFTKSVGKPGY